MLRPLQCLIASFILLPSSVNLCEAEVSRFVPLSFSGASAISDDGRTVAGGSEGLPFVWTEAGGLEVIPLTGPQRLVRLSDISGDGTTLVGGLAVFGDLGSRFESFRWNRTDGLQLLPGLPGENQIYGWANAVSYDGTVIVGTDETNNGRRAYRWTESTGQVDLGTLGTKHPTAPPFSEAFALTADGRAVVGAVTTSDDDGNKAFRWSVTDGFNFVALPDNRSTRGNGQHISGNGEVIVGNSQFANSGVWAWTEAGGFISVPRVDDRTSVFAFGLSHDGGTLVGTELLWATSPPYNNIYDAVIWRKMNDGYQLLRVEDLLRQHNIGLHGWDLTEVLDVSADGQTLVGKGIGPDGVERSWYAVLGTMGVPEPTSFATTLFGFVAAIIVPSRRAPPQFAFR